MKELLTTDAWRVAVIRKPHGFRPKSPDDKPRGPATPERFLDSFPSRVQADTYRRRYNRSALTRGLATWAIVTLDEELLSAGEQADATRSALGELGFQAGAFAFREVTGDNRVAYKLVLHVDDVYVDAMTTQAAVAAMRRELDRLEAAVAARVYAHVIVKNGVVKKVVGIGLNRQSLEEWADGLNKEIGECEEIRGSKTGCVAKVLLWGDELAALPREAFPYR